MSIYTCTILFLKMRSNLMSMLIIPLLFSVCFVACKPTGTEENDYVRLVNQNRVLNEYAVAALNTEGTDKDRYLWRFFESFPDDFETFHKIYSNNGITFPPDLRRSGYMLHTILPELYAVIPTEDYLKKMIGVGIGGHWEPDDIGIFPHHLRNQICENVDLSVELLEAYSANEVESVWYFMFDGPVPDHPIKKEQYEFLCQHKALKGTYIAVQLKKAYERLLSETDEHVY